MRLAKGQKLSNLFFLLVYDVGIVLTPLYGWDTTLCINTGWGLNDTKMEVDLFFFIHYLAKAAGCSCMNTVLCSAQSFSFKGP